MPVDTTSSPTFSPTPPPRPAHPDGPRTQRPQPGSEPAAATAKAPPALAPPVHDPRQLREARALSVGAFAVAATALLMPFTALVSLALATVGHAKGAETLGRAAFLASLLAMAAGFLLNLTVIDVMF